MKTSEPVTAEVLVSRHDRTGAGAATITVRDRILGSALAYMNADALPAAQRVFHAAEDLLDLKLKNPLGAAGGYVLLATEQGPDRKPWHQWIANLSEWFAWLPDGAIQHASLTLRHRSAADVHAAKEGLREAYRRGLPFLLHRAAVARGRAVVLRRRRPGAWADAARGPTRGVAREAPRAVHGPAISRRMNHGHDRRARVRREHRPDGGADPRQGAARPPAAGVRARRSKDQSIVVGSQLQAFTRGVDAAARRALQNAMLLAQLLAQKRAPDDNERWYEEYFDALGNLGLTIQAQSFSSSDSGALQADVDKVVLNLAASLLGGPATAAYQLVAATLTALQQLEQGSPAVTIFRRETRRQHADRFQVSVVEHSDDGSLPLSLLAFTLEDLDQPPPRAPSPHRLAQQLLRSPWAALGTAAGTRPR